ncbi:MAG: sigma-70 family RNA polymerase sigma factor [Vicinamibacterales bacterium]
MGGSDNPWAAFEAEVLPHLDRLFRLAMWMERDRQEAEDLVQETLIQALKSFHRFTVGTNCKAWLVTILHHVRSNRRRARMRRPEIEDPDDRIAQTVPADPLIPDHITDQDILAALRGIPEAYHDIILLCDVEGMTYKEIAETLAIPIGTVMSRLHRGRTMLRARLSAATSEKIS